jgi:hypothetical protein
MQFVCIPFNQRLLLCMTPSLNLLFTVKGFTYKPSDEHYWMQGCSTETDYIYVTTQFLTAPLAEKISEDVGTPC